MILKESDLRKLIYTEICNQSQNATMIGIGDKIVNVEIADTPASRDQGLMFRQHLAADSGMLFVFDDDDQRGFWMKNTVIPLSIAFLDSSGYILNIEDLIPHDCRSKYSNGPARYALEMNQGWFDINDIHQGDLISI